jgi:amino acid adenylation domain-containing protein
MQQSSIIVQPGETGLSGMADVSMVGLLRKWALRKPAQPIYTFLGEDEGEASEITFAELDARARSLGAFLQSLDMRHERAVLLFPPGLEYVASFLGCLYGEVIAVPAYPPRTSRGPERLRAIFEDAKPRAVITTGAIRSRYAHLFNDADRQIVWIAPEEDLAPGLADAWIEPSLGHGDLAFLQYTSGSTSTPKGVMVTHGNLAANEALIQQAFGQHEGSVIAGWLPMYHDMGLIGNILHPLYLGARCVLMSPMAFLQRPRRWLETISRYRATTSGGPNFAYELCVAKIPPAQREGLDLSSWEVAFNGAEPVRAATLERFAEAFAPAGFRRAAFLPCYGLAESTLLVSGHQRGLEVCRVAAADLERNGVREAAPGEPAYDLVSCGTTRGLVLVVDPETALPRGADAVGEIWVAGASVAAGYWRREEESALTFGAHLATGEGPFLRTGDLGFLRGGELFVTGRLKDLVIVRGRNHYPQDLEQTAERSHPSLRAGCGAAFAVDAADGEQLVIVQEVDRQERGDLTPLAQAIRHAVQREHDLPVHEVVLIRHGGIPKTTSGKIQRRLCRRLLAEGGLEILLRSGLVEISAAPEPPPAGEISVRAVLEQELVRVLAAPLPTGTDGDPDRSVLGLDSLMSVELRNAVEQRLGVSLSLAGLLQGATLEQLVSEAEEKLQEGAGPGSREGEASETPRPADLPGELPLSPGQRGLWFLHRLAPAGTAYHLVVAARLDGDPGSARLREALQVLVDRHAALRSTFAAGPEGPVQRIAERMELILEEPAPAAGPLDEAIAAIAHRPFDLESGPLVRAGLIARPGERVLVLAAHHLVADFTSLQLLAGELGAVLAGAPPELPGRSLADYLEWQERWLAGTAGARAWNFWRESLAGELPLLDLPADRPRPPVQTYAGAAVTLALDREATAGLEALAARAGATLHSSLLAAVGAWLSGSSGQDDLLVGVPASGRVSHALGGIVGYLANPVVVRLDLAGDPSFAELAARAHRAAAVALEHQAFPFPLLAERLLPERDPARSPLFQTMVVFHRAPQPGWEGLAAFALGEPGGRLRLGGLGLESVHVPQGGAQLDLTVALAEIDGRLLARLIYNRDLFDAATAERMLGRLAGALESAAADPAGRLSALELLRGAEREQVLAEWNRTEARVSADTGLHRSFERQARETPEATAVLDREGEVTYAELNRRANRLAHWLIANGVTPETPVGVCGGRSADLVAGLLGVLKAGGAYVPLDPAYPPERLELILEDSGAAVILVEERFRDRLPRRDGCERRERAVLTDWRLAGGREDDPAGIPAWPEQLAYLIYTSGSTGRPKGVAIRHGAAAAFLDWARGAFSREELAGVFAATSVCFDLSVFEIFVPLCVGGTVIVGDNALDLATHPWRERVTLLNTVPSAAAELVRSGAVPPSVRVVNLAGEPLPASLAADLYRLPGVERVLDLYGPSEDTTYSTGGVVERGADRAPDIGRPLENTRVYLLDRLLRPVPRGTVGDLWIAGLGLARGYLGRPDLTAERFLPDPFGGLPGGRLYRTGDLARHRPDGRIDFLGRGDHQVKVRGFRIELGEIEATLARVPGVSQVAVAAQGQGAGNLSLVAYVGGAGAPSARELRDLLERSLPAFMVPSAFVVLDALPLTPNGKIDRKALPAPAGETDRESAFVPPRNPIEAALAEILAEVLESGPVGIHDGFFALGGHSLLAARAVSRIERVLGVALPMSALFEAPTVEGLARRVAAARGAEAPGTVGPRLAPRRSGDPSPLSPAQERFLFLHRLVPESPAYHLAFALDLRGKVRPAVLARTLEEIVRRHEVLRTAFRVAADGWVQELRPPFAPALPEVDLSALPGFVRGQEAAVLAHAAARRPFAPGEPPLFRFLGLRSGDGGYRLLVVLHHVLCDGWSLGVLSREVAALYTAFASGEGPAALPPLPLQVADWALWQRRSLAAGIWDGQLAFWRRGLEGAPFLELPLDRPRPAAQRFAGEKLEIDVPEPVRHALGELGGREGVTRFMVLLATWATLLHRWTGQTDLVVGTPAANRDQPELEGLIGPLVNTLALRCRVEPEHGFLAVLEAVRTATLEAYDHRDLPFERLVEELAPERHLDRSALFQVVLSMQPGGRGAFPLGALEAVPSEVPTGTSKLDLLLDFEAVEGRLAGSLEYDSDLFDRVTAERLAGHFGRLLAAAAAEPAVPVGALPFLAEAERHQLLAEWNDTARPLPGLLIHQCFEVRAALAPDACALSFGAQRLTYAELDRRANRMARSLRRHGVVPEARVAVCLSRSVEMVVALLGVLKAGGAYVPLDPVHPVDRRAMVLEDSGATVLVTEERWLAELPAGGLRTVCLDRVGEEAAGESPEPLPVETGPESLAYVIFTSGSTGRPKGASLPHQAVVSFLDAMAERPGLTAADTVLALTTITFDISVLELFLPLAVGARIELATREEAVDGVALARRIAESGVTLVQATPTTWRMLLDAGWEGRPGLRALCGGEPLPRELADALLARGLELWNVYGPTETAVWSAVERVEPGGAGTVRIGRPIANTRFSVLDREDRPVPPGVAGELWISGVGVARCYWSRPDLTAERFVPCPGEEPGARAYRTGDLVRLRSDGGLEFIGRADFQVKLRGFRIELGEIEAALGRIPGVGHAAVLLREEGGEKRLVAYLTRAAESPAPPPDAAGLREALRTVLPDYMIPSACVLLDAFPWTPSGKVDRRALPAPAAGDMAGTAAGSGAPRTAVEEILAGVLSELLGTGVGVEEDFFAAGGHSLMALRAVTRANEALGVDLALRDLFEAPTVAGLAERAEALRALERPRTPPPRRLPRTAELPLSFAQERLWFLHQLDPGGAAYNLLGTVRLRGGLRQAVLAACFAELVVRHEALRSRFRDVAGRPVQEIGAAYRPVLHEVDLRGLGREQAEAEARRIAHGQAALPFDLENGPLLRTFLVRVEEREWALTCVLHHIVGDGWSLGVLTREMSALYAALGAGEVPELPELPLQYVDFAAWQREWLEGGELERQLAWWRAELAGAPPVLDLPTDRPRPQVALSRGAFRGRRLGPGLLGALRELARRQPATLFMVLLAAVQALLYRLSGQDDLSLGTPVAGRSRSETEGLVGLFVNTLVLRGRDLAQATFSGLLDGARRTALAAYAHQDLPFERLVEELGGERSLSRSPLFQVLLVLQDAAGAAVSLPGLEVEALPAELAGAQFDLVFSCGEVEGRLEVRLEYRTALFDAPAMDRLLWSLERLLAGAVERPRARLEDLPLLGEAERHQILAEWSGRGPEPDDEPCLHELVARQSTLHPERLALSTETEQLTYRELNARAWRTARRLLELGAGAEAPVGVFLERSAEQLVALLAVLQAGGFYLPLEPEWPDERLRQVLADSGATLLLTRADLEPRLAGFPGCLLRAEEIDSAVPGAEEAPLPALPSSRLAYAIYTSGSTGRPKGTLVPHRAIVNRLLWMRDALGFGGERVAYKTPFIFDASIWEIFVPWLTGGCVVVARPGGHRDTAWLVDWVARERIEILQLVPSLLRAFLDEPGLARCTALRRIFCGGEALLASLLDLAAARLPGVELHNLYGPTETAIDATHRRCLPGERPRGETTPIGRPLPHVEILIFDRERQPAPAGAAGELLIGGVGLARGYLGRPELTAERFVPHPLAAVPGARLYRTGDRARWLPDGAVEFLGRVDHQVKLRGFRIEPGEIEAVLCSHPEVREAAVVVRRLGETGDGLVGYVVAAEGPLRAEELRRHLATRLPEHMVPALLVELPALPRTPGGKLDRNALPIPELSRRAGGRPAETPAQQVLAAIWGEVLGIADPGLEESFFDLGGHSLLATRVMSRVREAFAVDLPLRALFEAPTVEALATRIEEERGAGAGLLAPPIVPAPRGRDLPLSFAQQRLWFLNQLEPGSPAYNLPAVLRLRGPLDPTALAAAVAGVVARHESLRTAFVVETGEPVQVIRPAAPLPLPCVDLSALPPAAGAAEGGALAHAEVRRPFDLASGEPLRALLVRLAAEEHLLAFTLHHIVSDAWSSEILVRETAALYRALCMGEPALPPPLRLQYADFAVWQRSLLQGEVLAAEIDFWRRRLEGAPPVLDLPADRPRPALLNDAGGRRAVPLPVPLARAAAGLARESGTTLFMTLLAAWEILLARSTGQTDLTVGTPVAGRTRLEVEGLIGFFVNTLVLRTSLEGEPSGRELLGRVREVTLEAHARQELPFEKLVEELRPERSLGHTPLFQAVFVLHNARRGPGDLGGLEMESLPVETGTAKFDLTLAVEESGGELLAGLEYRRDLFDPATIDRLLGQYATLLAALAADPGRAVTDLPLLAAAERRQILLEGGAAGRVERPLLALHRQLEEQAAARPEAVALVLGEERVSYGELNRRANRLARHLRALGVGPESPVALCLERSTGMLVAILGVLKAGGGYVPLEPGHPQERLAFVLADCAAEVLVSTAAAAEALTAHGLRQVLLDADAEAIAAWPADDLDDLGDEPFPEGLAYVIYTSGSTGLAKGVPISHAHVARLLAATEKDFGFGPGDVWTLFHSYAFDFSVWEVWGALAHGGRLVIVPHLVSRSPEDFRELLLREGVTVLNQTPAAFRQLVALEAAGELPRLEALRAVIFGGEGLDPSWLAPWVARYGTDRPRLVNMYGITETTVHVTVRPLEAADVARAGSSPIGGPISDLEVHVLDPRMEPVPFGVAGEMFVGGPGLARGYLRRPELTAQRFVPHPFAAEPGERLYRSGDLARRRPGGELEFVGRADHQVKIRGFRIELGEIEAAVAAHPGVREAVVLLRDERGEKRLVAYLIPEEGVDLPARELRAFLAPKLPEPMLPSAYVRLETFPLTVNGKLDRRALEALEVDRRGEAAEYVAPRTAVEQVVAGVFAELLDLERVGLGDDFFALGGHSLLATRAVARLQQVFRIKVPLRDFFGASTVEAVAALLVAKEPAPGRTEKIARLLQSIDAMPAEALRTAARQSRAERSDI